jgi:uncharacterized membrane protein YsdA (DUF1294 family)/cold shock CspA family protein
MRFKGVIKSWNDERGFGFIAPLRGGDDVFLHIKAFPRDAGRPQINQRVTFDVEVSQDGKKRARNVEVLGRNSHAERGTATLVMIPAFVCVYVVVGWLWEPPFWIALIYLIASIVTFSVYANDKANARQGKRRTPEGTLHMLSIAGGWPGALLAQQFLRHKSAKAEFRSMFWGTVILNIAAFVVLCSPLGRLLLVAVTKS